MKAITKDKINLTYWNIDKYIKQAKKYNKVNGIAISQSNILKAQTAKRHLKRLINDIGATGLYQYRISMEQMIMVNKLYRTYKINLEIHPQYTPPRVRHNG